MTLWLGCGGMYARSCQGTSKARLRCMLACVCMRVCMFVYMSVEAWGQCAWSHHRHAAYVAH